ncbi:MAG: hypothetical protein ACKOYM_05230 [Actinomycetes bacterium]
MSDDADLELDEVFEPVAQATINYLGPVAPHWEITSAFGDPQLIAEFKHRVNARLMLLPPRDPQFRKNKERVARDAERELIELEWNLGEDGEYLNR